MDWFLISILCALSLASSDTLAKKYLFSYSSWQMLLVRFSVPGIMLIPVLYFYPLPPVPLAFWGWLAILLPLEILAMSLYMLAIRDAPLYQTLPYLAFTPVFNIVTGWLVLSEQVSLSGAFGIILVVVGAYLLNIQHAKQNLRLWAEPLKAIVHQQGARRMLLAAIIYSFTSVGGKAAMQYAEPVSFGALYFVVLGFLTLIVVALIRPKELTILKQNHIAHFMVGGFMAIMVITHFVALSMVETAYMIAVKRISLLFGILFGAYFFKEEGLSRNLAFASLMVAGAIIILFA